LAKGADVNAKDGWNSIPLHISAMIGDAAMTQLLLERGADVELKSNVGETALQKAATNGCEGVVKVILKPRV